MTADHPIFRPADPSLPDPVDLPEPATVHSRTAALALLVILAFVWGVHWVVVKIGLDYMPPFTYAALRVGSGLLTMVALLGVQGRLRRPDRSSLPIIVSVGIAQVAAGVVLMNLALQAVPAGRSSVLVYTMPLWVAVLLAVLFGIRPRRNELIGLVLGIGGICLLLNPTVIDWSVPGELWGSLALVLNAVLWAAVTVHIRRHRWTLGPLDLQPWQLLAALMPIAVVAVVVEQGREVRWELATILVLLFSGPLATAFATWASQSITRSLGAQASATGFLAIPVVGLASGFVVLGEALGPLDLLGFVLVLAGVGAASLFPRASPPAPP